MSLAIPDRKQKSRLPSRLVPLVGLGVVLLIIALESPRAVLFLASDGVVAAAILAIAALAGLWLPPLFRLGELPLRWHLLLGAGLGIGSLALLVLTLGLAGWLGRTLWGLLLIGGGLAGGVRLVTLLRQAVTPPRHPTRWLWLAACPFAALALLVALVPPGLLWAEEGNGYDALEYHLQMPREYFEAGRIHYAPHNVYANFPANAEMFYLLAMIVQGGPLAGVTVATLINALLAFLTVAAAWLAGRETSPTAGMITGLLAATAGWLTYLSGVPYVENAMLFFAMLSAAALVRAAVHEDATSLRWITVAGVLAGFSAGCKYTALVLIVVPLALAVWVMHGASHRRRLAALGLFALFAALSFAPWALRNLAFTGNPVFPLANHVFHAYPDGWSAECSEHFDSAHAPGPEESSCRSRLGMLWSKVIADQAQRFGPTVFLLAGAGLIANRGRRLDGQFGLVLTVQIGLWLALTHLYARFAVVFLVPLVILGGRFLGDLRTPARKVGLAVLLAGVVWNLTFITRLYRQHLHTPSGRLSVEGTPEVFTAGRVPSCEHLGVINGRLPQDAKILLVGEARAFYFLRDVDYFVVFNRNPFVGAAEAATAPSDVHAWLTAHGYTHVYVAWGEIERLRRSRYGFPEIITRPWFDELAVAGVLRRTHAFGTDHPRPYAELSEVEAGCAPAHQYKPVGPAFQPV
ncbi:MAG: hypothetical protein V2A79_13350 [Planctomycetota bacterium]